MKQQTVAIYPGSFDPVTNGHLDLIERASKLFGHLVVAILLNPEKDGPFFPVPERVEMLKEVVGHLPNVEVDTFKGLLVDYARRRTLHDVVGRWQADALDAFEPIGDVAARVLDDIHTWQLDGASLPEPPKVKRPPAIVVRPNVASTPRTLKERKRRYPKRARARR